MFLPPSSLLPQNSEAAEETEDTTLYDDSGVSDVTSSSEGQVTNNHMTAHVSSDDDTLTLESSYSEKLALVRKKALLMHTCQQFPALSLSLSLSLPLPSPFPSPSPFSSLFPSHPVGQSALC